MDCNFSEQRTWGFGLPARLLSTTSIGSDYRTPPLTRPERDGRPSLYDHRGNQGCPKLGLLV